MRVLDTTNNVRENEEHYDQSYREVNVEAIVAKIADFVGTVYIKMDLRIS